MKITVTGTGITTQQLQQQQQMYGGAQQQIGQENIKSEPTIELLNRFVAKDTHCLIGRTGVKISRICLGTMNFGKIDSTFGDRPGQLTESEAHAILDRFVELGGNCIDTADFFPWFGHDVGRTETIIGNWLSKQQRSRIFIITKLRMPLDPADLNSVGLSRCHMYNEVNAKLKRLQTTWIDMLLLNGWDHSCSFSSTVRSLHDLVTVDKIRYYGACDFKGWQLQKLVDAAKTLNLHSPVCYMGEYNLMTRGVEWEVLEVCKSERIGFVAYSPLKYGFLTDEMASSGFQGPVPNSRIEAARSDNLAAMAESFNTLRKSPTNINVINVCHLLARKHKVSVSQIAIQWLLQSGVVTSVCLGVESVQELEQAMRCLVGDFLLSQEDIDELNFVSSVPQHYPYHTQLSEIIGVRKIRPIANKTEFEGLNVRMTPEGLEFNVDETGANLQRLNLRETVHESLNQQFPEREFMRHLQMKTQPSGQPTMVGSMAGQVPMQSNLGTQGRMI